MNVQCLNPPELKFLPMRPAGEWCAAVAPSSLKKENEGRDFFGSVGYPIDFYRVFRRYVRASERTHIFRKFCKAQPISGSVAGEEANRLPRVATPPPRQRLRSRLSDPSKAMRRGLRSARLPV